VTVLTNWNTEPASSKVAITSTQPATAPPWAERLLPSCGPPLLVWPSRPCYTAWVDHAEKLKKAIADARPGVVDSSGLDAPVRAREAVSAMTPEKSILDSNKKTRRGKGAGALWHCCYPGRSTAGLVVRTILTTRYTYWNIHGTSSWRTKNPHYLIRPFFSWHNELLISYRGCSMYVSFNDGFPVDLFYITKSLHVLVHYM